MAMFRRYIIARFYSYSLGHNNQVVIFQNPDDRDTLIALSGLSTSKIEMVRGSGVDLNRFSFSEEASGLPLVLFPARLLADKGVFEFVKAAQLLFEKGIRARFVLAGIVDSANPASVSQRQLEDWVAGGVIEHWGYRTDMPQVIAVANLVVLPSYREGLPKVLLEAAASGRAVVTTDAPGCRDAIVPGMTGLLVAVRDHLSLAFAIEQLLANPEERKAMGLNARRLAESEFDVRVVVEKHVAIYRRLLD